MNYTFKRLSQVVSVIVKVFQLHSILSNVDSLWIPETMNLGGLSWSGPCSHQFEWNQYTTALFHLRKALINAQWIKTTADNTARVANAIYLVQEVNVNTACDRKQWSQYITVEIIMPFILYQSWLKTFSKALIQHDAMVYKHDFGCFSSVIL